MKQEVVISGTRKEYSLSLHFTDMTAEEALFLSTVLYEGAKTRYWRQVAGDIRAAIRMVKQEAN